MIYGFDSADGYDLTTERARAFTSGLIEERDDGIMFLAESLLASRDRRLDMLNVKYIMVSKPGRPFDMMMASDRFVPVFSQDLIAVFENKRALPRFFTVPAEGIEIEPDAGAQLARLKADSFDPERSVIFSDPPAPRADAGSQEPARVQLVESRTNGHRLRVDCSAPVVLVVSQMYYPGWKATIDGSVTPVYAVDLALTGLLVPAGSHDIAIFFRPAAFEAGLVISLVSVVAVVVLLPRRSRHSL
jgi:hypothetical protein